MAMFGAPIGDEKAAMEAVPAAFGDRRAAAAKPTPAQFSVASDERAPAAAQPLFQVAVDDENCAPASSENVAPRKRGGLSLAVFCDDENSDPQCNENDENDENSAPASYSVPSVTAAAAACAEHGQQRSILGAVPGIPTEPLE